MNGIKLLLVPIIAEGDDNRLNDNDEDELPLPIGESYTLHL
jgi:hypothetical protein